LDFRDKTDAVNRLGAKICQTFDNWAEGKYVQQGGPYFTIFQSSGYGKTRLLHRVSTSPSLTQLSPSSTFPTSLKSVLLTHKIWQVCKYKTCDIYTAYTSFGAGFYLPNYEPPPGFAYFEDHVANFFRIMLLKFLHALENGMTPGGEWCMQKISISKEAYNLDGITLPLPSLKHSLHSIYNRNCGPDCSQIKKIS
jgi:hypothetical protein